MCNLLLWGLLWLVGMVLWRWLKSTFEKPATCPVGVPVPTSEIMGIWVPYFSWQSTMTHPKKCLMCEGIKVSAWFDPHCYCLGSHVQHHFWRSHVYEGQPHDVRCRTEQVSTFTHLMLYVPRKKRIFLGAPLPWQRIKMNQGTESFLIRG
jgi:hypothetical protein